MRHSSGQSLHSKISLVGFLSTNLSPGSKKLFGTKYSRMNQVKFVEDGREPVKTLK